MKLIRLVDPEGQSKAIFNSPVVTSEDLLRAALSLAPTDELAVRRVGQSELSLAVLRPEGSYEPVFRGLEMPEASQTESSAVRASLAQSAWLDKVNAGWSVEVASDAASPRSAGPLAGFWQAFVGSGKSASRVGR